MEVHVPQPGDVAAVGVLVVDGDHRGVVARPRRGQREAEPGGVLHEQQLQRPAVHGDGLPAAEGGGDAGELVHQRGAVRVGAGHGERQRERGRRVVHVVDAVELHGGLDGLPAHREPDPVRLEGRQLHVGGRPGRQLRLVVGLGVGTAGRAHVVVGGEHGPQRGGQPEPAGLRALGDVLREGHDPGVLPVEDHGARGGRRDLGEHPPGGVDLAEAVELVAHDVEQQRVAGLDLLDEVHGVRLVELEHGDVRVEAAREAHLPEQGGGHAAHEVGAGAVGEDLVALRAQQLDGHLGGGRLAVGAADEHHAVRQLRELLGHEPGVQPLHHEAGEGGASAAQGGQVPDALAEQAHVGSGHALHPMVCAPAAAGTRVPRGRAVRASLRAAGGTGDDDARHGVAAGCCGRAAHRP